MTTVDRLFAPRAVAVVGASGGVNHALAFALVNAGNEVSLGGGIGTGLDVGAADVLEYLRVTHTGLVALDAVILRTEEDTHAH